MGVVAFWIVTGLLAVAGVWLLFLYFLALLSLFPKKPPPPETPPRFLVIVPAHNEEAFIQDTVRRVLNLDYPRELFQLYVVADNCTDRTPDLAREAGAQCIERNDPERRGKGFGLDFALKQLVDVEADAVLFLDADSRPAPDYLRTMAAHRARGELVVQGSYAVWSTRETWLARLSAMSFTVRNRLFFPGLYRLGLTISLRGTGMLFDRKLIQEIGWPTHDLTEDLEMTLILIERGLTIFFAKEAVCLQYMPPTLDEARAQRLRWSGGERTFRRDMLSRVLPRALRNGYWKRALACLYLTQPGFSAQLLFWVIMIIVAYPVSTALSGWALGLFIANALYVALGAPRFDLLTLAALGMIPFYAAWRLTQAFVSRLPGRVRSWVRTDRPKESVGTDEKP